MVWRYVRASMSIATVLPPMPDPVDGHLLVDGCYLNNVPGDVMRSKWSVGNILAIDVGCQYETHFTNYGDSLSGWGVLTRKIFPFKYFFRKEFKVPNLYDIQSRLSYVSCTRQLEELKASDYCEYIRPPIDKYQTLQFGSFDEIKEVGYQHGTTYFSGMLKGGRTVESVYQLGCSQIITGSGEDKQDSQQQHRKASQQPLNHPTTSFTDLAQLVCSVRRPIPSEVLDEESSTEDDGTGGYASEPSTNTEFFNKVSVELSEVRRRRTGSLSDNDIIDVMTYNSREDEDDEEEEGEADNEDEE
ncbi:hypothetical protein Pmani_025433 [Petrolisthes manimaculis]|uniref:PNPLA domain-containing protein n=1 Tax=Petrolisthes manimaculis TaxID=1843537 RepID=A0AAE1P840_9EUCA|nr:hypothetical protein Pmani_025433 [Petrolisthes manimaculis]